MAERGHGVAVIPSALRTDRHALRIVGLTYRDNPLREPLALFWDKRRPLPRYAAAFCEMLAAHMREVFPVTRPHRLGKIPKLTGPRSRQSPKRR
jgi:DNA-binding transcriptional LysR family regulator